MPTEADAELENWQTLYDEMQESMRIGMIRETQLQAKSEALRQAGIMAPSMDLENMAAQIAMARQAPGLL